MKQQTDISDLYETLKDERAERAVLGALLLEPTQVSDIVGIIKPTALNCPLNARIYALLIEMCEKSERIDLYTVFNRCKAIPELSDQSRYIAKLTDGIWSATHTQDHARIIQDKYIARQLYSLGQKITTQTLNGGDVGDIIQYINTSTEKILSSVVQDSDTVHISEGLTESIDAMYERMELRRTGKRVGITTGLTELDQLTGGWQGGQLIILAGRPAMGKSALMLHFAKSCSLHDIPVCIFSQEMSRRELCDRLLSVYHDVDKDSYKTGDITAEDAKIVLSASNAVKTLPIYINDKANIKMQEIRSICQQMAKRGKCGLAIIDYLQLLDLETSKNQLRERNIADATRSAKMLAKELNIPIVVLSQLSRKIEDRKGKDKNGNNTAPTPMLSDLRESGAIEQDADIVAFIDRPSMYDVMSVDTNTYGTISTQGLGRVIVSKQRNGGTGMVLFSHDVTLSKIRDFGADEQAF